MKAGAFKLATPMLILPEIALLKVLNFDKDLARVTAFEKEVEIGIMLLM